MEISYSIEGTHYRCQLRREPVSAGTHSQTTGCQSPGVTPRLGSIQTLPPGLRCPKPPDGLSPSVPEAAPFLGLPHRTVPCYMCAWCGLECCPCSAFAWPGGQSVRTAHQQNSMSQPARLSMKYLRTCFATLALSSLVGFVGRDYSHHNGNFSLITLCSCLY